MKITITDEVLEWSQVFPQTAMNEDAAGPYRFLKIVCGADHALFSKPARDASDAWVFDCLAQWAGKQACKAERLQK